MTTRQTLADTGASQDSTTFATLLEKIESKEASIAVVGLGYVGLPLALTFAEAGFGVTGIDVDAAKLETLRDGRSYVTDVPDREVAEAVRGGRLTPTDDWELLGRSDVVMICVPTPLRKTKDPDLTHVMAATASVSRSLRPGQLVVLESTTYPGTTEEVVRPELETSGLRVGKDFFLAFSPERVDPGNEYYRTRNIPKVVGGTTARCGQLAKALYGQCVDEVMQVSGTRVAEMVKLLENTFRSVNIALVNEIAMMCAHMGIDVWETIRGAATKPFGFMPFYPGPGLGGHCIPIDPMYLQWKAKSDGFDPHFIGLADRINSNMPRFVVGRIMDLLNDHGKALRGARVHLLGVTYKRDVSDVRESPALKLIELLEGRGAEISYSDPFVPVLELGTGRIEGVPATAEFLATRDLVVIATDHSEVDYEGVVEAAPLVFDTRNATAGIQADHVSRL